MEIRSPRPDEHEALLDLLERAFDERAQFALYMEADPCYRDDDFLVAFDGQRAVACVQIFEKRIRAGDTILSLGGIGSVATDPDYRSRGLASDLMRRQTVAMQQRGYALGLLFTGRITFYEPLGWVQCMLPQVAVHRPAALRTGPATLRPFLPSDLPRVKALYDDYSRDLLGTTLRDDSYWAGQLRYAGNPEERFHVAETGGEIVAYARTVKIGLECAMEYGRLPTAAEALAQLIVSLAPKPGALVLRTTPDPGFRDALKTRAARVDSLPDPTPMWRVLDRTLLGSLVGNGADGVDGMSDAGLVHALVEERAVHYWLSDRF